MREWLGFWMRNFLQPFSAKSAFDCLFANLFFAKRTFFERSIFHELNLKQKPTSLDIGIKNLCAAFWRLRREIIRRGFALFGSPQFNLPVNVGRKAGRDARRFLNAALFLRLLALKMFDGFGLHFGGNQAVERVEVAV